MSMREREGLIARIRQIRRVVTEAGERPGAPTSGPGQGEMHALEARITHLEQLVEGLQDSVHRESSRLNKRVSDLEARMQPSALGKAVREDARERGL